MGKSQSAIVVAVGMSLALTAANALAQTESANQRIVPPVKSAGVSSFLKYLGVGQLICKSPHASGGWDVTVAPYGDWRVMEVESDHIVVCELSIESRRQLGEASVVPTVLDDSFVVIPVHQIASLVIERDGGGQPAPVVYSRRLPQLPTASGDSIAPPAKATSRAWPLLTSTTPAARTGKTTRAIYRMNPDGSDVQLVACLKEYDFLGTPAESHDGESLACDAWDDDLYNAHLVVMKADGSQPFDFGPGAMPSWSPDDTQIAYHSYGPGASGI